MNYLRDCLKCRNSQGAREQKCIGCSGGSVFETRPKQIAVYVNGAYVGPFRYKYDSTEVLLEVWTDEKTNELFAATIVEVDGRLRATLDDPKLRVEGGKIRLNRSMKVARWQRPRFKNHMKVSRPRAGRIK